MKNKQIWVYLLSAALVASVISVVVLASALSSVRADLSVAEDRAEEAHEDAEDAQNELRDELDDLEAKLEDTERSLRNARKKPPPVGNLTEQLANGTAVPTSGLSVSLPAEYWSCTQWRGNSCKALKDEAVFKNETQIGSAVTCLFEITYEDGATTRFTWSSDYVPPGGGTDTQVIYFYSDYSSGLDLLGERDCYRGSADYTSGIGE